MSFGQALAGCKAGAISDTDLEQALDELFATPPDEFVAARNTLAKRLRAEKLRDEAAVVAAQRRPHRIVWALNQLALDEDPLVGTLADAVQAVRSPGDRDQLRQAMEDLREAVRAAAAGAAGHLDPSRPSDRPELSAALHAVVGDADAMDRFEHGRLVELPSAGVAAFGGTPFDASPPVGTRKAATSAKATKRAKAGRARTVLEEPVAEEPQPDPLARRRAERAVRQAREALERDRTNREKAERTVKADEGQLAEAEDALRRAEADRAKAAEAAERSAEALARAQAQEGEATAALDTAEADLDALDP